MYCLLRPCYHLSFRLISKINWKYIFTCVSFLMLLDYFGAFTHLFEVTYDENFIYPYNGDIHEFVSALRNNQKPNVDPINEYNYSFILNNKEKCIETGYSRLHVVYIVKSSVEHIDRREAIRNSWGFEKRFFDVPSRTAFILGVRPENEELQAKIKIEASKYKDIIQANFIDSYYNNTIKTMIAFKWAVKYCSNSKFYMFIDDDMYVSVKNVLRFVRNPANYPDYLKEPKKIMAHKREIKQSDLIDIKSVTNVSSDNISIDKRRIEKVNINYFSNQSNHDKTKFPFTLQSTKSNESAVKETSYIKDYIVTDQIATNQITTSINKRNNSANTDLKLNLTKRQIFDLELPDDVRLFAGFVFVSSPHRHKSSKWYVSLQEYPYHLWPPYVTAGAYIISKEALLDMYYTSFYTKHFKFDDIFLALVAKKADIEPFHCDEFHFYKKDYTKFNYKYVITSHGYDNPNELLQVWNEQKALGNA